MNEAKPEPDKAGRGLDGGYKAGVLVERPVLLTILVDTGAGPQEVNDRVRSVRIEGVWSWTVDATMTAWHWLTLDLRGADWGDVRRIYVRQGDGPWLVAVVAERAERGAGLLLQGVGYYV